MGQVSKFLRRVVNGYVHYCPGCDGAHVIHTDAPNLTGGRWTFDGNVEAPTFHPSIHVRVNAPDMQGYQADVETSICHYFLRAGRLSYCQDSTHALAGQDLPLPELPLRLTDRVLGSEAAC